MATFGTLSDRLTETFRNLRTKGKLTPADVDGTVREIRRALLDADVALRHLKERRKSVGQSFNQCRMNTFTVMIANLISYTWFTISFGSHF